MTFVEAAGVHSNPATSARALGNARKALAEIQRCLKNPAAHGLSKDEVVFLEKSARAQRRNRLWYCRLSHRDRCHGLGQRSEASTR